MLKNRILIGVFLVVGLVPAVAQVKAELNPLVEQDCANCHGNRGQGNDQLKGPAIAALPDWYVISTLEKFKKHARGIDTQDKEGTRMHAMAVTMDESEMKTVAEFISKQKPLPAKQTVYGNALRGKMLYDQFCVECHGPGAMGIEAKKAPPLVGYQDWYILSQVEKFRTGSRGVHPQDPEGFEMHKVAKKFSGEKDVSDLAAFILDLAGK